MIGLRDLLKLAEEEKACPDPAFFARAEMDSAAANTV